jgi:ATP-binding cassette, subfamily B, bacterial PglK
MYLLSIISKSILLLSRSERIKFIILICFFLFSAVVQVAGVASIAPFMTLLTSPETIHTNKIFAAIYNYFHFTEATKFMEFAAICSLLLMVFSNAVSMLTLWFSMKFSIAIGNSLQCRLYENIIFRPYLYHKTVNHSYSISTINTQAPRFVYMVMQPILLLLSNLFIGLLIVVALIIFNPITASIVEIILGGAYLFTYLFVKLELKKHGDIITEQTNEVYKILSEGFIGIKEVTLSGLHNFFIEKFKYFNLKGLHSRSVLTLIGDIPKFVIETVAFSIIFIAAIVALKLGKDSKSLVPLLSIFAIAGYKLLPTLQQIYKSITSLSGNGSVSFDLLKVLSVNANINYTKNSNPFETVQEIQLENIEFKYPSATENTIKKITIAFSRGMINTIAGNSGSGKTTLIDILLGLIPPDSGRILIDNKIADSETLRRMQQSCGYVPQHIFILDDTIISNVAFGVGDKDIDEKRLIEALKKANILDFVLKLPKGIHTKLGEDGKLLSGGQRQKIGIARSLYKNLKILILDEPTSALDIESEYEFMMLLRSLKDQMLIIIISHRPSAIKCSDVITIIDNGKIEAHGALAYLEKTSPHFRSMLQKSSFNIQSSI